MDKATAPKKPYTVRETTSGRTGVTKYVVVLNPGSRRVSNEAHLTRDGAQAAADQLNIGAMVRDHDVDPRPYAVRLAEAEAAYFAAAGA